MPKQAPSIHSSSLTAMHSTRRQLEIMYIWYKCATVCKYVLEFENMFFWIAITKKILQISCLSLILTFCHDDVIKWDHFPRYWPFVLEFTGPGEFPAQWPVTRSSDVFFDLRLNKLLNKQPQGWWFETPPWSLWRHCHGVANIWNNWAKYLTGGKTWKPLQYPNLLSGDRIHIVNVGRQRERPIMIVWIPVQVTQHVYIEEVSWGLRELPTVGPIVLKCYDTLDLHGKTFT